MRADDADREQRALRIREAADAFTTIERDYLRRLYREIAQPAARLLPGTCQALAGDGATALVELAVPPPPPQDDDTPQGPPPSVWCALIHQFTAGEIVNKPVICAWDESRMTVTVLGVVQ